MIFFVTHYTPLIDRKENIIKQFTKFNITNYEFIELYDKEKLNIRDIEKFIDLKLSEISLFLKHIEIFKKNINDIIIVLEDDAIFIEDFLEKIKYYLNNLPKNWDIIFSGECCNMHLNYITNKIFYESNGSRGTCMYILNKNINKKLSIILENTNIINKPVDHWFDSLNKTHNLKYYWTEPVLVHQGSETGLFKSVIKN